VSRVRVRPEQSLNQSSISMSQDSLKSKSEVAQSCLTLRDPMDCSLPVSSVSGIFQTRVPEWGQEYRNGLPFPSPGDLPNPGMEPGSPALQTDALPSEPPGKPNVPINIPNWTTGSQDGDL